MCYFYFKPNCTYEYEQCIPLCARYITTIPHIDSTSLLDILKCQFSRLDTVDVFSHEDAVYGLSPCPTDESAFASAGADGRILLWDLRQSTRGK